MLNKLKLWNKLRNKGHCSAAESLTAGSRICGCGYCGTKRWYEAHGWNTTHWHGTEGDADYLNTWGTKGNRWKHFGNQGRQSDTLQRRKGKVPETRGKLVIFKIKQEMMRHESKCKSWQIYKKSSLNNKQNIEPKTILTTELFVNYIHKRHI